MAVIHIPESEAVRDFAALLTRVRGGAEVIIDNGLHPVAILRAPAAMSRSIEDCIAMLPADSRAVIDEAFADDLEAAVAAHPEALHPPEWD
jgi:antitoxin (DNA-binding transcriptional repressor) of toxin-antitoxin stability system